MVYFLLGNVFPVGWSAAREAAARFCLCDSRGTSLAVVSLAVVCSLWVE